MASRDDEEEGPTIADPAVLTKFQTAAEITNKALRAIVKQCIAGASIRDICKSGDKVLEDECDKVYKKDKNIKKGIAFPTCICVNHCIGHYSPLDSEPDTALADGDLVKIDLGAHVDGFPAVVAHSLVVGAGQPRGVTGRAADAVLAAHTAIEAALRLIKPGQQNDAVTAIIGKAAAEFQCRPVEGMLSHQLEQFVINGEKTIIQNPTEAQRLDHETVEFEEHEVYAVDVIVSTGDGTSRELDARTTIYKKTDEVYSLKMKASREFFSLVSKKSGPMPFNLRSMGDEKKAKLGVIECVKHGLIEPYAVIYEKPDQLVAQFKYTVLLMPNNTKPITGLPFDPILYQSEHAVTDQDLQALLAMPLGKKSAHKKKKSSVSKSGAVPPASEAAPVAVAVE